MSSYCICGHSKTQHPNRICDYAGYSCRCTGYTPKPSQKAEAESRARRRNADHVDGYDRDDLGESPDY